MASQNVERALERGALGSADYLLRRGLPEEAVASRLQTKHTFLSAEEASEIVRASAEASRAGQQLLLAEAGQAVPLESIPLVPRSAMGVGPNTRFAARVGVSFVSPTTGKAQFSTITIAGSQNMTKQEMIAALQRAIEALQREKKDVVYGEEFEELELLPEFMSLVRFS